MIKHASPGRQAALRAGHTGFVAAACLMILGGGVTLAVFARLLVMASLVWLAITGRSWAAWAMGAWLIVIGVVVGVGELNAPIGRALLAAGLGVVLIGSGVVFIHFRHSLATAAND